MPDKSWKVNQEQSNGVAYISLNSRVYDNGSVATKILYRKPTHTDLYLQWESHHTIAAKYSVVNTLLHRAQAVCSNSQLLKKEEDHLRKVLQENMYPIWALNRVKGKTKLPSGQEQNKKGLTSAPMLQLAIQGPIWWSHM